MSIHVFGIRHHGPGCARSLRQALLELSPDVILLEGPADAADVLSLAGDEAMKPPVALLVYPPDAPQRAVFYPFAEFSPEWQAIQLAHQRSVPIRFMDLPHAVRLAIREDERTEAAAEPEPIEPSEVDMDRVRDPMALLAQAAGYSDHELWWDAEIERRRDATGVFQGIAEAMTALREEAPPPAREEQLREAWMRQTIRTALKEGHERIAVVCGAWHAPVLADPGPAKADATLLKGLGKRKVVATWIPWTHGRLTYASGYGAGVARPGWYEHLWRSSEKATIRWATQAARLLRGQDLDASSANVIETVRLAEALASMRDLRSPGLAELDDATLAVLCRGEESPLALIAAKLHVGDRLGQVPPSTPRVPLREDLATELGRLKLKPTTEIKPLDLDLRRDLDRNRSRLLHRLTVLGIDWATLMPVVGKAGTFHEVWELHYKPELEVAVIEAAMWGNTVTAAATARVTKDSDEQGEIAGVTALLDRAILAELAAAIDHVLERLQNIAAVSSDVPRLMGALPVLARIARYGDVRATPTERILPIVDGLFERVVIGLPVACGSLDDDAARAMSDGLASVHGAVQLLEREGQREEWQGALRKLLEASIHGLVAGHACRLLLDLGVMSDDELERLAGRALSAGTPAADAAAWCEGLLRGSGLLLLHKDLLWRALDAWVRRLEPEPFREMLPLIRRAFSGFERAELRAMGDKVKKLGGGAPTTRVVEADDVDPVRGALVLPVLARILGVAGGDPSPGGAQ